MLIMRILVLLPRQRPSGKMTVFLSALIFFSFIVFSHTLRCVHFIVSTFLVCRNKLMCLRIRADGIRFTLQMSM